MPAYAMMQMAEASSNVQPIMAASAVAEPPRVAARQRRTPAA